MYPYAHNKGMHNTHADVSQDPDYAVHREVKGGRAGSAPRSPETSMGSLDVGLWYSTLSALTWSL